MTKGTDTQALYNELIRLAVDCVQREFPNTMENRAGSPVDVHPVFFGCFDWHSAVHSHWAMVHVLRKNPEMELARDIRSILNDHFTAPGISAEIAFLQDKKNYFFECPYGWAWFLRLCHEVSLLSGPDAKRWRDELEPLRQLVADRSIEYFSRLAYPIRYGIHQNSAFSMTLMLAYADRAGDSSLSAALREKALSFFNRDTACPVAYEPSGNDFLSPCLAEACLMRHVLAAGKFADWFSIFLPESMNPVLQMSLAPPAIHSADEPLSGHLIGLAFHRAWTLWGLAASLDKQSPRRGLFLDVAQENFNAGMEWLEGSGYAGTHWLATFAIAAAGQSDQ